MDSHETTEVFQAEYIPKQTPPKTEYLVEKGNMRASLSSYPPLGEVTVVPSAKVLFTVSLETDERRISEAWQVALWHSANNGSWKELALNRTTNNSARPAILQNVAKEGFSPHRIYFSGTLDIEENTSFTLKFRSRREQSWKWAKEQQGVQDGTIIVEQSWNAVDEIDDLEELIGELNPAFETKKVQSQTPNTSVWSLGASIAAARDDESTFADLKFGKPWKGAFIKWFALVRIWTPWLCPRQGRNNFGLDKEGILCSFLNSRGRHLVLLAISGVEDVLTTFASDGQGNVILKVRNDDDKDGTARVVVALGDDFESANAAAMYHARSIVSGFERITGEQQKEIEAAKEGVDARWMENWFDGLTYCTWNGLGQQLTEGKVFEAVDTLAAHNINITNLIIDDNWQALDYRGHGQFQHGWSQFDADPKTFPSGLKEVVSKIRSKHTNIQHIAVWHALWGYWGGLDPTGTLAKTYKTVETARVDDQRRNLPLGGKVTVVAKEDVPRFYDDFYAFLTSCGIDAVKTDAQFMFDTLKYAGARADLFTTYLDAWMIASLKHFSIKAISCMSQTPQILFHSQLPTNRPAILVRNSDDFFPDVAASHPWHVWTNAHNALLTSHLNILPDWDMFQTVHDYSGFHAAARCVSGGPIYFTDVPGEHDLALIDQMTGPTPRGKTVIFRPSVVGKSLDQYVGYDDEVLLKVGTYHGAAVTGTSILGIFNTSPRPLTELFPLSRFPGTVEAQYYVVRSHSTGDITEPMQIVDPLSLISISLGIRGYEILSAYPLRGFVRKEETLWLASLGLLGKMTGAAAVVSTKMELSENGKIGIEASFKALGVVGFYISTLPTLSLKDGMIATILGNVVPVDCIRILGSVLEIDVPKVWKDLDLNSGWSNEVVVKLYINQT
ncbi:MAG: hypothetical protein M1818_002900 [Claussenomyces sp. TS43310]|nr:MAG: hypothetical protein M1818_002900 [Claussenomyces sp. TS43310]